ncbi:MAG TPA: extracellular solute-binding protein [Candidatus Dormibacteraeota bacterium]|nr:extracellular solute-binding protein [Candidatus Dormibacteraeota bacterium]
MSTRQTHGRRPSSVIALGVATLVAMTAIGEAVASTPVSAASKQTITFAESGLGSEGAQTQKAINAFEKANPSIKVHILVLSPNSTTYLAQLEDRFIAGSSSPDVIESDVTYPAKFAKAGWIKNLASFKPNMKQFFATEVAAGTYKGKTYAIPWFDNPEGLFYRTDLIKTPPKTPAQVVSDAEAAMKADPSLKEGIAFEGAKYEGAITAFATVEGAFGGKLNPEDLDTSGNRRALTWLYDALYVNKIAPQAVIGWMEGNVESEFQAGNAAFAINYPFVASTVASTGGPAKGHVGYIPFPANPGGTPGSALGGEMLAINSKTTHSAAAYKLIQYLASSTVETARAIATGDPPSLPAAYTPALISAAPYFKQVETLNKYAQPRPVSPNYLQISSDLQTMLSSVFSNLTKPAAALAQTAPIVKADAAGTG